MTKPTAIVLLSGGLDSCVTAALAARDYDLAVLHATYGQRTADRERQAFHAVADAVSASHRLIVDLSHLAAMGGSSLTDAHRQVEGFDPADVGQSVPGTYVPFRNGNLLAAACSWAEVLSAPAVFIGAVAADSSGYPDCRPEFLEAFATAVNLGTRPDTHIDIRAPLIAMTKAAIVQKGHDLKAPLELTWSCYTGHDLACGTCESCGLRLRGFQEAGLTDPIAYAPRGHGPHGV